MSTENAQRTEHSLIEERAARWLARRDANNCSPQEEQEFDAWMNESMAHSVAYWRLQDAWDNALRLRALGAGVQSEDPPPPGQWNISPFYSASKIGQRAATGDRKQRPWSLHLRAFAAGLAVIACVLGYLWSSVDSFETPLGAMASLPIEDGSKITLNTDSGIKVDLSDTERRVELQHGEAFFEVAKDPARPFFVNAGDKRVIAVGTRFSVRRGIGKADDDIEVVVTEGAVRIESVTGKDFNKISAQLLTAGAIARTAGDRVVIQQKPLREAEEFLSWRSGVLVFRDVTLAHAAAEFNRYNKRKIVIEDPSAAALKIAGNFRTTNVDSFVEIIAKGYPVRVAARKGGFVVSTEH